MNAIRKLLFGVLALTLLLFGALVVNQDQVQLTFLIWHTPELSVFWWLLAAFTLGGTAGFILAYLATFKTRLERRRLKRSVDEQASELQRLKALPAE